jgi:hypothetical protein
MILGVTGSRNGMTDIQRTRFTDLINGSRPGWSRAIQLHFGDAIGVDQETFTIAVQLGGILTISHPPNVDKYRAFCSAHIILPTRPYAIRNQDIVVASTRMVALPSGEEKHQLRSGTWQTVRFSVKYYTPVLIIFPDGREELRQ